MASLEPQGAGKTSPIFAFSFCSRGMEALLFLQLMDGAVGEGEAL